MELIQRRREMMAMQSGLPAPYRRVEYIGAEGANPYINTGLYMTAEVEFEFHYYNDKVESFLFGARKATSTTPYCNYNIDSNGVNTRLDYGSIKGTGTYQFSDSHDGEYLLTFKNRTLTLKDLSSGGTTKTRDYSSASFASQTNYSIYMFAANTGGSAYIGSSEGALRIYSGKIWIGGKLAGNYIPCVRKADDKPGMYDTVTRTFLTSTNTDEFVYGELLPGAYQKVEYLENSGTQYIDTLYIPTKGPKIVNRYNDNEWTG